MKMRRPPSDDESKVKRRLWTAEEDEKLLAYVSTHGIANWDSVPEKAGLSRGGSSCRNRWLNHLNPDLKHERFTPQEEEKIIKLHATLGSRWSMIASQLPGRTDNDVKNYWNTKLKKKLLEEGIDPFTHRSISDIIQIIGGFPATATATSTNSNTNQDYSPCSTRINNRDRDLKNTLLSKATPIIHPTFPERKPSTSNLLPQLHDASTITIVTYTSSNEASSSFTTTVLPILPELKWSDFLIEDVFLPDDEGESEPKLMEGSARVDQNSLVDEWWGAMDDNVQGSPYDGSSSFVVAILDRHQETLFQFLEFLDDTDYIL